MELDNYRIKPTFITKHRISRGLGGKNAVQYYTNWDEVSVKTWEHETNTEIQYLDIGLEIRYKSEEKMQNIEGVGNILFVGPGITSSNEKVGPNSLLIEVRKDEPGER